MKYSDAKKFADENLGHVHDEQSCAGRTCIIHNPSSHHMRDWLLNWRQPDPWGIDMKDAHFERICQHGIGHPDPDDLQYHVMLGRNYMSIHGCDGCCASPVGHDLAGLPLD